MGEKGLKKKSSKKINKAATPVAKEKSQEVVEEDAASSASSESVKEEQEEEDDQIGKKVGAAAVTISREEYLQAHRDLTFDKQQLQLKNNILHRRLAEYYKKRKMDHVLKALEGAVDLEEKYQQKLLSYEELKEKEEREMAEIKSKLHVVDVHYRSRLEHAEKKFDDLQHLENTTGTGLIYSKKGKPIADKTVHRYLTLQRRKSEQASALCLRYIRVRNAVAELEAIVRKLEQVAPGLFVAQYEQLFVDHQNYATKIEEREDELIKNRGKCTEHNQILAHIREKMQHTDEVIDLTECDFGEAEMEYQRAREDLGSVKTRRDKLRWSLEAERLKAGLLTRKDLLRDYENATDEVGILRQRKLQLESQIEKTTNDLREARKRVQLPQTPSIPSNNATLFD
ncbi:GRIP and coiled-coil domain-containing protein 2 [Plodia interpunctella]|uniref:GRIP and coiled-coil domain-containing protein 2 n=1 Tax=Plodia interpunctella TaxID=58824 RepID=UPI0023674801|nr:GRIP and coiled-coil domain-containing protein 2 [Plodia interpunctella]